MFELLDRVRRHASIATGNFERLFAGVDIPPLPTAIARLVAEVNRDEPDQTRLAKMVGAMPEIGGKVLSTVNSVYFALPNQVSNISHGLNLLGMKRIRSLVLSFAMRSALPAPPGSLFDATRFWSDSLLKALLARALADHCCPAEREDAFTAMLLSDIALPVLLGSWGEYYRPLIEQWRDAPERLSQAERASFQ
ncbi:MAG: HDOD domain-containing protein [Candidatus Sedimenticola endophacoides]